MVRRSPWLNQRAAQLVRLLDERHGHTITEDTAREDISNQVDLVAERMQIGRQAAKYYVTEDYIAGFADHIAALIYRHNDAVRNGEVSDLAAKREESVSREPTPLIRDRPPWAPRPLGYELCTGCVRSATCW